MSVLSHSPLSLRKKDFFCLHELFQQEVAGLLPVPARVSFRGAEKSVSSIEGRDPVSGLSMKTLTASISSHEPVLFKGGFVLPLHVEGDDDVAVIVEDMDSELTRKMAVDWLRELRENVQQALLELKRAWVDEVTGLYNRRLLEAVWPQIAKEGGTFFLIGIPERSRSVTQGLSRLAQTAHLLEAWIREPVFSFGGGVFGVYRSSGAREDFLGYARYILGRLKREGRRCVHIGMARIRDVGKSVEDVLGECWQALETAEKRGPYSLCDFSTLSDLQHHPLAPPDRSLVSRLQARWRGMDRFALLRIEFETTDGEPPRESLVPKKGIEKISGANHFFMKGDGSSWYLLLPGFSPEKAVKEAEAIKKKLDAACSPLVAAVGVSYWPCAAFPRTATLVNCRKAIMHGRFFGPGSVTLFDHVSLNVSGDYYYDEGDYRQAVREYRAGLLLMPGEVNLLNSLGVALTELNRLTEAVRHFDQVLENEPENFMALVNRGSAMRMLGREEEAIACLAAAVRNREFDASPVAGDISLQLGRLYYNRGRFEQAVETLEPLAHREGDKGGYLLYSLLGRSLAAVDRNDKAMEMLQKAVRLNPHDALALSALGEIYQRQGEGDDIALSLCVRAVQTDETPWDNWYRLAKVRFSTGNMEEALGAIEEALRRNGKTAEPYCLAAQIYSGRGEKRQARKMLKKALRLNPGCMLEVEGILEEMKQLGEYCPDGKKKNDTCRQQSRAR
ncbi:MAG: hypothetical protein Kow0089_13040 [Desulfobulbaceae bacterium]